MQAVYNAEIARMRELREEAAQQAAPQTGSMNERIRAAARGEGPGLSDAARQLAERSVFTMRLPPQQFE